MKPSKNKPFSFFVPGPLPGMNEIIKASKSRYGKSFAYSLMKRRWTKAVADSILMYAQGNVPKFDCVQVVFKWAEKNKRRDPDNVSAGRKFVLDGMVKAGLIPNDNWRHVHSWDDHFLVYTPKPGVYVSVVEKL